MTSRKWPATSASPIFSTDPFRAASRRLTGRVVAFTSIVGILLLTMRSNPALRDFVASTPLTCVICGEEGALDFILNILFFSPLGAGLFLAGVAPGFAVAAGGALSLLVETIQYFVLVGRDASLGDLLANTLGTALGVAVARAVWSTHAPPVPAVAQRWLAGALALGYAGLALGGWSLEPSASSSGQWRARTAYPAPDAIPFRGTIDQFLVGAVEVRPGPVDDPATLRAALLEPVRTVTIRGRGALLTDPQSWLAGLDADGHVEVSVGQEWCAFTYSGRRRAFDLRLHEADIFVETTCRDSLDTPFEVRATQSTSAVTISAQDPHGSWQASAPLYLATGWVSFWPYADHLVPRQGAAEVAWIALLLLPAGLWMSPAGAGTRTWAAVVLASIGALYLFTAAFGMAAVLPLHLVGIPLGLGAGWLMRFAWGRVQSRT